jgi:hypothetical protein
LSGTIAAAQLPGIVSAVKAAHLFWHGYPYEAMTSSRFFRLSRVLSGLRKTSSAEKKPPKEPTASV